jgi:alpha-glucosidase
VPLAGVWLQDWVGQRTTSFGSRLLWNWTLNPDHYPNWSGMVAELRHEGIRVLTYINPMLTNSGVPPNEPNLFAQAAAGGYLVRNPVGTPYLIDQGGFSSGLVDLSNPAARRWMIGVLRAMARTYGASGWMGRLRRADAVRRHICVRLRSAVAQPLSRRFGPGPGRGAAW